MNVFLAVLTVVSTVAALTTVYFARGSVIEARKLRREDDRSARVQRLVKIVDVISELVPASGPWDWQRVRKRVFILLTAVPDLRLPDTHLFATDQPVAMDRVEPPLTELATMIATLATPQIKRGSVFRRSDRAGLNDL